MHIVIMGCGRVGSSLALRVEEAGHSVAIIDQDPVAFRRLGPEFAGTQVTGVGFDRQTLIDAGIERADAFAAVSSGDNSNIISARVARETFSVNQVVARIYDPKRAVVYERLGIPTVATVAWATHETLRALIGDAEGVVWRDPSGRTALVEIPIHEGWIGRRLTELEAVAGARVAFLTRFGSGTLPDRSTVIQQGDQLYFTLTDDISASVHQAAGAAPEGSH